MYLGTKVTWLNTDPKTAHSLIIQESQNPNELIFFEPSIPFMNSTEFTFNKPGTYFYSNPLYSSMKGTINVIHAD